MTLANAVMERWMARLLLTASIKHLETTFKFVLSGPAGGAWVFDCHDPVRIAAGAEAERRNGDCTIEMPVESFMKIARGVLNPQTAYLNGEVTVTGDFEQALKFSLLLDLIDSHLAVH